MSGRPTLTLSRSLSRTLSRSLTLTPTLTTPRVGVPTRASRQKRWLALTLTLTLTPTQVGCAANMSIETGEVNTQTLLGRAPS